MTPWKLWKSGFDAWEKATAGLFEKMMASPAVLTPAGALLSAFMKAKAKRDEAAATAWANAGLATRKDQERVLHQLSKLESRLLDLEERLAEGGVFSAERARDAS